MFEPVYELPRAAELDVDAFLPAAAVVTVLASAPAVALLVAAVVALFPSVC